MVDHNKYKTRWRLGAAFTALALLSGCATFSKDGGFDRVEALTKERVGQDVVRITNEKEALTVEAEVSRLLGKPLSVEDAVRIALFNNRGLQASYAELGIAEADLVQAGRLRNPVFSFARLKRGDEMEYERSYVMPIMSLLTMPIATRIERRRFEQAQLRAAANALRVADDTRRAYFTAIAAQEAAHYTERVNRSAAAGAELARRMAAVGNWSRLDQARQQAFYADTATQLARAQLQATAAREELTRLMGVWGTNLNFQLPDRLPELPDSPREIVGVEMLAMQNRLDIMRAERELQGLAGSLGLTRATRFINLLDVGYLHNNEDGEPRQTGYEIELQIPLFDWGNARVARAEATYMQAVHRASEIAVNARSAVRAAYAGYRTRYDVARHYRDEVLPLRKRISEENQLRYNGMLISVFELLADARAQFSAVNGYIEASRDYWIADSSLQMALTGTSTGQAEAVITSTAAPAEGEGH